jgi:hypothetical protein
LVKKIKNFTPKKTLQTFSPPAVNNYSSTATSRSFLDALTALARILRLRAAKSLCLRGLGFAPGFFFKGLRFAHEDHCTSPLIFYFFLLLICKFKANQVKTFFLAIQLFFYFFYAIETIEIFTFLLNLVKSNIRNGMQPS